MPRSPLAVVVAFSLALASSALFAAPLAPSTEATTGTLPNGLRYVVIPHPSPKNDVAMRLIVHAGSLDERDDERGFAHFVEHMAFQGTTHYPPGGVRKFFQKLGLSFGADLNASTNYTYTTYLFDLPDGRASELEEALIVLRDYADGVQFPADQVASESGVVISELHSRDLAGRRALLQLSEVLFAGTGVPNRAVSGLEEQLAKAKPEQLRAFYRRNYQPSRMTVLLIGPLDAADAVKKITETFSSMKATPEAVAPAPVPLPKPFVGTQADLILTPTANAASVELIHLDARLPDTAEGHRTELAQQIAISALNNRLNARREAGSVRFGVARASALSAGASPAITLSNLEVQTSVARWTDAVGLAETELRRALTEGFSPSEISEAVAVLLTSLRNHVPDFSGQSAAAIATTVVRTLQGERHWRTPEAELAEAETLSRDLKPTEIAAALRQLLPEDSTHLILRVKEAGGITNEQLMTAYRKSAAVALKATKADAAELTFRYAAPKPAGKIAQRTAVDDLDLTLVSFANGVRFNVRPSKLEPQRFTLRVTFDQYAADVPRTKAGIADLAGMVFLTSDLGKHTESEMVRLGRLHGVSRLFSVTNGTGNLVMSGPVDELPFALQWLSASLSDLKYSSDRYQVAISRYQAAQKAMMQSPSSRAVLQAEYMLAGEDARVILPPPEVVRRYLFADVCDWMETYWLRGPIEIGLVGDVTVDEAVANAATTVGALPSRDATRPPAKPLVFAKEPARQELRADLPASAAVSCVVWPNTLPDEPRTNAALALAIDVLRDRLHNVLRASLGATYSPQANLRRDRHQRDYAFIGMINTFDPLKAKAFTAQALGVAAQLAAEGVSADEFARLREPIKARYAADLHNDAWWLANIVSVAQSQPEMLAAARARERVFESITLADVNAAARLLTEAKATVVIMQPSATVPAAKPATPTSTTEPEPEK